MKRIVVQVHVAIGSPVVRLQFWPHDRGRWVYCHLLAELRSIAFSTSVSNIISRLPSLTLKSTQKKSTPASAQTARHLSLYASSGSCSYSQSPVTLQTTTGISWFFSRICRSQIFGVSSSVRVVLNATTMPLVLQMLLGTKCSPFVDGLFPVCGHKNQAKAFKVWGVKGGENGKTQT